MEVKDDIAEARRLLKEAGFEITIGGCGCCGSPWVYIAHNGKPLVSDGKGDAKEYCRFSTED